MQEALHRVHAHYHSERYVKEEPVSEEDDYYVGRCYAAPNCLLQEYLGELGMGEGQGPQTQVGCSIRNRTQHELDRLDDLMNEDLAHIVSLLVAGCLLSLMAKIIGNERLSKLGLHVVFIDLNERMRTL